MRLVRNIISYLSAFVLLSTLVVTSSTSQVDAVAGFEAGRIIDDQTMRNSSSMSASQIQTFLNSKLRTCDTYGAQMYSSTQTRKQYAASRGVSTPFTCLKDYKEGAKTSAQLIKEKADKYGINPQVLIVLLQKEQGLVTDDWPWPVQYRTATGYGCPDTAPCASEYFGLANQLDWAAKMFRAIVDQSPNWYSPYMAGYNPTVYWHPDTSRCGGRSLNISNWSTASLYSYTPYRPNQAALNAGYGVGNTCSAYGNRNFFLYFRDWFGSPNNSAQHVSLDTPRWMQVNKDTYKIDHNTGQQTGNIVRAGSEIFFPDKITYGGTTYLRTKYDSDRSINVGIPLSDISNISPNYTSLPGSGWKTLSKASPYLDPTTEVSAGGSSLQVGRELYFDSQTTVGGKTYWRTKEDSSRGISRGFLSTNISEITPTYTTLSSPSVMVAAKDIYKKNILNESNSGNIIKSGTKLTFADSVKIGGKEYWRVAQDSTNSLNIGILRSELKYPEPDYTTLENPKIRRALESAPKISLLDGKSTAISISRDQDIAYSDRTVFNGVTYLRSEYDAKRGNHLGVIESAVKPIQEALKFVPLDTPRTMKTTKNIRKVDMVTLQRSGNTVSSGTSIKFTTKILYNGQWHLRSEYDSKRGITMVIPFSELRNL